MSIAFRYVLGNGSVKERLFALKHVPNVSGATLCEMLVSTFNEFGIKIDNLRGACFDGAPNMSGYKDGLIGQLNRLNRNIIFFHDFAHISNLINQKTFDTP